MAEPEPSLIRRQWRAGRAGLGDALRAVRERGGRQIRFWFIALLIGIVAGFAALFFRKGIEALQAFLYGTDDILRLHSFVETLPWYWVVLIPTAGGLAVGLLMHLVTGQGRVHGVADVIEGAALHRGRVAERAGFASALASFITLSSGGSSGREGPVVHLAAVLSSYTSRLIRADGITARDLMGCAVAAAVSASFNAPIAGALFALEVVLRHFAVHAFAPIVIASVAGTVINRLEFGDVTEFRLATEDALAFYIELPAFLLLGLLCGVVAALFMRSIFLAEDWADHLGARTRLPGVLRPALAGLLLGLLATGYPHIIGVGYETIEAALTGQLLLHEAIVFCALKIVAVAITLGGRMGGGVFSPSLMVGALTGLGFGIVATALLPEYSGSATLYALAGLGAVTAAVLGAPISTTLIVFELTGDWQTGLAVMVSVSLSTALASKLVDRSFFLTQLERRGVHLWRGPQAYLLALYSVADVMRPVGEGPREPDELILWDLVDKGLALAPEATLEVALPMLEASDEPHLPVLGRTADGEPRLVGALHLVDALRVYNRALAATAAEEHS